jgi:ABC-type multidrug transport system ATPase subunit
MSLLQTVGRITGDILVNGRPKEQSTWARVCGYVEQMDIHIPHCTVYEALTFSAHLRLETNVNKVCLSSIHPSPPPLQSSLSRRYAVAA